MSQIVTLLCEDHNLEIDMVTEFTGLDEDGLPQYEILHGVDKTADKHEDCDLSIHSW